MPQAYCLVVQTTTASALPRLSWWSHNQETPELYGFRCRYFNPQRHHELEFPHIVLQDNIGFYGIEDPSNQKFVCEIEGDKIVLVMILKMEPGKALAEYKKGGINRLVTLAQLRCTHTIHQAMAA